MSESFKERVREAAIDNASLFKTNLIDYEYCIFSSGLSNKYVIAKALGSNYLHLVGVNTGLSADAFFQKCLNKTLTENDFDFLKKGVSSDSLKGAVRDKIRVLNKMVNLFYASDLKLQEHFTRNKIHCAFASASNDCTLGFAASGHPKSLLRGNYLNNNPLDIDLIVRKQSGTGRLYSEIVSGDIANVQAYAEIASTLIATELFLPK